MNISDFLFLLKHGMPTRFAQQQQAILDKQQHELAAARALESDSAAGSEEGGEESQSETESDDAEESAITGKRPRDETSGDEGDDAQDEENTLSDEMELPPFEDTVLIKRRYIHDEQLDVAAEVVEPEQAMLSCEGCYALFEYVDDSTAADEEEQEDEEQEEGMTVNSTFVVTLSADSWNAYMQAQNALRRSTHSAAVSEDSQQPVQKKRLSKAEKKKLQKNGGGGENAGKAKQNSAGRLDWSFIPLCKVVMIYFLQSLWWRSPSTSPWQPPTFRWC